MSGRSGPSYGRGRGSRAYCALASFSSVGPNTLLTCPTIEWLLSCSMPFAVAVHVGTSKVPLICSDVE